MNINAIAGSISRSVVKMGLSLYRTHQAAIADAIVSTVFLLFLFSFDSMVM